MDCLVAFGLGVGMALFVLGVAWLTSRLLDWLFGPEKPPMPPSIPEGELFELTMDLPEMKPWEDEG